MGIARDRQRDSSACVSFVKILNLFHNQWAVTRTHELDFPHPPFRRMEDLAAGPRVQTVAILVLKCVVDERSIPLTHQPAVLRQSAVEMMTTTV